jgi:hypothetical protein
VEDEISENMHWSPWMAFYPMLLAAGIVLRIVLPPGVGRIALVAACVLVALGLVLIQVQVGFPLMQALTIVDGKRPGGNESGVEQLTSYTPWFWLAQLACLSSLILLYAEWRLCAYRMPTVRCRA